MTSPSLVSSASQECGQLEAFLRVTSPCPYGATSHSLVFIEQKPQFEDFDVGTAVRKQSKSSCYLATSEEWPSFLEKNQQNQDPVALTARLSRCSGKQHPPPIPHHYPVRLSQALPMGSYRKRLTASFSPGAGYRMPGRGKQEVEARLAL